jgi:hypothetical protein
MTFMVSKGMLQNPLVYGKYKYIGLGQIFAGLIVGIPISFVPLYVIFRVYKTEGTLKEAKNKQT